MMLVGVTCVDLTFDDLLSGNAKISVQWDNDEELQSQRLVTASTTPNRIVDVMVNRLINFLGKKGWDAKKSLLGKLGGSVPFKTNNGEKAIKIDIVSGVYRNIGSLRRSKIARINVNRHLMTGTLGFENLEVVVTYKLSSPAVGQAPAASASGKARTIASKYFVDFTFMVDTKGMPLAIQSWTPRKGKLTYMGASGLDGSKFQGVFNSILKDATKGLLDRFIERELMNIVKNQVVGKMVME